MFDVIIAGSGAAGTFSAYSLRGLKTLVLDVGHKPPLESIAGNWYDLKNKETHFNKIIGPRFESLNDIEFRKLTPTAKAPLMRYVIKKSKYAPGILSEEFSPTVSYAEGGLANIWGAQVYRFNNQDLKGYPITSEELGPFYDELIKHIGVSGSTDDLAQFFGGTSGNASGRPTGGNWGGDIEKISTKIRLVSQEGSLYRSSSISGLNQRLRLTGRS